PWGWVNECRNTMKVVFDACNTLEELVAENEIFQGRSRSIGIIPPEVGAGYGVSGSNLRASGVDWDLRRDGKPYLVYPELDFKVWTHPDGDSFARYWVRLQETRESARMVLQMLEQMPAGPIMAKVPRIIKVPEGEVWVETENPLGQMGYYVVSKGATGPFRVKIRSASFSNVSILKMMSHMQSRLGPMDPGGFHGWFQLVGDGIKFIQKEDVTPAQADKRVFALAPAIVVISTFLVFLVIPAGPDIVVKNLD